MSKILVRVNPRFDGAQNTGNAETSPLTVLPCIARLEVMSHAHADPVNRAAEVRFVLYCILVANIAVVAAKLAIGWRTGSLAVFGDAMHSSVDSINNVLALFVISVAVRGPDEEHPYGHQKFETLGALAIVGFLSITGFELVKGAVRRLLTGALPLEMSGVQIGILVGTLVVNVVVATYESHKGRQLDSEILLADATHTKADVLVTIGVLGGVLMSRAGIGWADPIVALAVAVVIIVLAWGILARSVPVLVDKQLVPATELEIATKAVDGVRDAYAIRSRGSRFHCFAELTISVDHNVTVETAHKTADAVERELMRQYGFNEVTVHIEPC